MKRLKEMKKEAGKTELMHLVFMILIAKLNAPDVWWASIIFITPWFLLWYFDKPATKWMNNEKNDKKI